MRFKRTVKNNPGTEQVFSKLSVRRGKWCYEKARFIDGGTVISGSTLNCGIGLRI